MDIQQQKLSNLPLSWQYTSNKSNPIEQRLILSSQRWLTTFQTDFDGFRNLTNSIREDKKKSFLIRGCNTLLTDALVNESFDHIVLGKEAVLNFSKNHFEKKSLRELIKRGFKKGQVIEVARNEESNPLLDKLKMSSRHGKEPQLKHLFITEFIEGTRLFVFINRDNEWLAAVLVSINSPDKYHTELLLKHNDAPIGVMETLIFHTFESLKDSGKKELSLGEVPFYVNIPISKSFYRDFILNRIAKFFRFAYNYKGLYDFKNKFNPRWDDVFICGYPRLRLSHIAGIIIRSNLLWLIFYKILKR